MEELIQQFKSMTEERRAKVIDDKFREFIRYLGRVEVDSDNPEGPFSTIVHRCETRDKKAALKFLKKAMRKHGCPEVFVTDKLRSYGAALKEIGAADRQETGRWLNNRAENSHLPFRRRERAMLRFRRMRSIQKFAAVHASVSNHFNQERSLSSRPLFKANRTAALAEWRGLCAA